MASRQNFSDLDSVVNKVGQSTVCLIQAHDITVLALQGLQPGQRLGI